MCLPQCCGLWGSPQAQTAAQGSHSVGKEKMSRDRQGQDSSETQSCYPSIAQKGERKRKLQDTSWLYLPRSQAFFILTSKIPLISLSQQATQCGPLGGI